MKQYTQTNIDFLIGFNEGYLIAKYEPELSKNLSKIISNSPRILGLKKGQEQFVIEQKKEMLPEWLRDGHKTINIDELYKNKNKDFDLDR